MAQFAACPEYTASRMSAHPSHPFPPDQAGTHTMATRKLSPICQRLQLPSPILGALLARRPFLQLNLHPTPAPRPAWMLTLQEKPSCFMGRIRKGEGRARELGGPNRDLGLVNINYFSSIFCLIKSQWTFSPPQLFPFGFQAIWF